jgi:hypothetical protein
MRLWRTGALAVENAARFPPRAPLPTASKALTILIYLTNHNNIQGSAEGLNWMDTGIGGDQMLCRATQATLSAH